MAISTRFTSGIALIFSEVLSKLFCVPFQITGSYPMTSLGTVEAGNVLATLLTLRVSCMLISPI